MIRTFIRMAPPCIALASCLAAKPALAQKYPFPTSGHYMAGNLPSAATAAAAMSSYNNWKAKYLKTDCGNGYYRVNNPNGGTFSEGQGYGMVLTAYFGDKTEFDGLWAFAQHYFVGNEGLMDWDVSCSAANGNMGTATDGDTDIGFGLIVAAAQWGGTYLATAKTYLANLKNTEFSTCMPTGRNVPDAGDWDKSGNGGCTATNTSYWMPAYYRAFGAVSGDSFWNKAADDVVALYNLAANPNTGIIVNEVDQNGKGVSGQTFDYNSCRIPWRSALDYLWYGTPGAGQWMTKLTTWANGVGIKSIVDGYNADGSATGQYTGLNAFVGGFASGAVSSSQSLVDTFGTYFVSIQDDNGGYYGSSLRTLYLLMLSGNQWNPLTGLGLDGGVITVGGSSSSSGGTTGSSSSSGGRSSSSGGSRSGGGSGSGGGASGSGGSSGSGGGGNSGGGTSGGSGAPGTAGTTGATSSDGGARSASGSSSGGCGCMLASKGPATAAGGALAALLALVVATRAKSSSRRRQTRARSDTLI